LNLLEAPYERLPDLGGRDRHVDSFHAERCKRVMHRIDDGGDGADGSRFARPLGAERVGRLGVTV